MGHHIYWGPVRAVFEVSSLSSEHVVKPSNFGSSSGYRPISIHRLDTSVKTKLQALASSDQLHSTFNLQPSGNSYPMLHWVDDVFDKH
jgi:hypothetical protein